MPIYLLFFLSFLISHVNTMYTLATSTDINLVRLINTCKKADGREHFGYLNIYILIFNKKICVSNRQIKKYSTI